MIQPDEVSGGIDAIVDAAVARYGTWAQASPIMLVHAATAPRAAGLVLPSLPPELWVDTHDMAWAVSAATSAAYRPLPSPSAAPDEPGSPVSIDDVADHAVASRDEHAIKFAEVALESHRRGNDRAIPSGLSAAALLTHRR